jgi:hypothetical protein
MLGWPGVLHSKSRFLTGLSARFGMTNSWGWVVLAMGVSSDLLRINLRDEHDHA